MTLENICGTIFAIYSCLSVLTFSYYFNHENEHCHKAAIKAIFWPIFGIIDIIHDHKEKS